MPEKYRPGLRVESKSVEKSRAMNEALLTNLKAIVEEEKSKDFLFSGVDGVDRSFLRKVIRNYPERFEGISTPQALISRFDTLGNLKARLKS